MSTTKSKHGSHLAKDRFDAIAAILGLLRANQHCVGDSVEVSRGKENK